MELDFYCLFLVSCENTIKGTVLLYTAGKEDPVELDYNFWEDYFSVDVEHVGDFHSCNTTSYTSRSSLMRVFNLDSLAGAVLLWQFSVIVLRSILVE